MFGEKAFKVHQSKNCTLLSWAAIGANSIIFTIFKASLCLHFLSDRHGWFCRQTWTWASSKGVRTHLRAAQISSLFL